jgi:hypothetical protein
LNSSIYVVGYFIFFYTFHKEETKIST